MVDVKGNVCRETGKEDVSIVLSRYERIIANNRQILNIRLKREDLRIDPKRTRSHSKVPLYSGHAENLEEREEWGRKIQPPVRKHERRGWNVAVNSGRRDVRISSYVWRPYFFHDDSGGPLTESRNFGTAPNYYRPVCFTLCPRSGCFL